MNPYINYLDKNKGKYKSSNMYSKNVCIVNGDKIKFGLAKGHLSLGEFKYYIGFDIKSPNGERKFIQYPSFQDFICEYTTVKRDKVFQFVSKLSIEASKFSNLRNACAHDGHQKKIDADKALSYILESGAIIRTFIERIKR